MSYIGYTGYTSQALQVLFSPTSFLYFIYLLSQEIPSVISPDDRKRLDSAYKLSMEPRMVLYQEMIDRYSDSHPYLLVRLADIFVLLNADTLAIALFCKVSNYRCLHLVSLINRDSGPKHLIDYGDR
jgi:hypothetical protein